MDKEKLENQQEINLDEQIKEEETDVQEQNEQVNEAEIKYNELYDKYLRVLAEYDNYKKRTQKEKDDLFSFAVGDTVTQLLPVVDNLERAISVTEESSPLLEGVQMVLKQTMEIFEKLGVVPIEAVNQPFDPNLHDAVMHVEDENCEANIVVEEFMKGYQHKDKVIRHSMVKVAN